MTDELDAPLGQGPKKKTRDFRLLGVLPYALAGVLGAALLGVAGWAVVVDDPLGGEPVKVVAAKQPAADAPQAAKPPGKEEAAPPRAVAETPASGGVVNIIDGMSGRRQQVTLGPGGGVKEIEPPAGQVSVRPIDKISTGVF